MKFDVPATIEIGPMTIAVTHDADIADDEWGEFRYDKARILIDERLRGTDQGLETFVHETVEAINMLYELKLPHRSIQVLGAALAQMIKSAR